MPHPPRILARGPWPAAQVSARWSDRAYEPLPEESEAADAALAALRERGSPAHDGRAARLDGYEADDGELRLELQRMRWALRLVDGSVALSVLCVVRDAEGRWLAGRRAPWVAAWAGMWALGAAGAVDAGENPARALGRELEEEWGVVPERLAVEALIATPNDMAVLVGQAWLAPGAQVHPDGEHDAHQWWPADPVQWPEQVHPELRLVGDLLA